MKGDTFETETTVYTKAGKVWDDSVKLNNSLQVYVRKNSGAILNKCSPFTQKFNWNTIVYIFDFFFGVIDCGEILKDV